MRCLPSSSFLQRGGFWRIPQSMDLYISQPLTMLGRCKHCFIYRFNLPHLEQVLEHIHICSLQSSRFFVQKWTKVRGR